jgi:hypothetical protein
MNQPFHNLDIKKWNDFKIGRTYGKYPIINLRVYIIIYI